MKRLRSIPGAVNFVASVIAIAIVAFGLFKLLKPDHSISATAEAKQVVGFHQVTNSICAENQQALERAVPEAHSTVQLIGFLVRGVGWGVNDLEGVTAPASVAGAFAEEIANRKQMQGDLLELQSARETGDLETRAQVATEIAGAEASALEREHELGLRRCAPVLPSNVRRAIDVS
jgi:hypothetical protein